MNNAPLVPGYPSHIAWKKKQARLHYQKKKGSYTPMNFKLHLPHTGSSSFFCFTNWRSISNSKLSIPRLWIAQRCSKIDLSSKFFPTMCILKPEHQPSVITASLTWDNSCSLECLWLRFLSYSFHRHFRKSLVKKSLQKTLTLILAY